MRRVILFAFEAMGMYQRKQVEKRSDISPLYLDIFRTRHDARSVGWFAGRIRDEEGGGSRAIVKQ